jgi:hypothetical protein
MTQDQAGPQRRYSIVTTARWETAYIAEWLAYHRSIGFDHVYLYCNDDDPAELYTEVCGYIEQAQPFVTFIHCPHQGQQWFMLTHFFRVTGTRPNGRPSRRGRVLSLPRDGHIARFMAQQPEDADSIYIHWSLFGDSGFEERPPGSVLLQYTWREEDVNAHTKNIVRTASVDLERLKPEYRRCRCCRITAGTTT